MKLQTIDKMQIYLTFIIYVITFSSAIIDNIKSDENSATNTIELPKIIGCLQERYYKYRQYVTCDTTEFMCTGGKCIPETWKCDFNNDCDDNSDETDCPFNKCNPEDKFMCGNGNCIPLSYRCDGTGDCPDRLDEKYCSELCSLIAAKCIYCNGLAYNKTDEKRKFPFVAFSQFCPTPCTSEEFECRDLTKELRCIPKQNVCDSVPDCDDLSDESPQLCTNKKECSIDQFKCSISLDCIPSYKHCNGIQDCFDGSDELGCDVISCETYGSCDQTCTSISESYECSCDPYYTLSSDNHTCKINEDEGLLLYSTEEEIRGIYLGNESMETSFQIFDIHLAESVSAVSDYIYWATNSIDSSGNSTIFRWKKDISNPETIVISGFESPLDDVVVDWLTMNIYFTQSKIKYIGVCTNDGNLCAHLKNEYIDKPTNIVLSPTHGLMFWIDVGSTPLIARSGMDGSNPVSIVTEDILRPSCIALDIHLKRVYWVDTASSKVETIKFDTSDRRTVFKSGQLNPISMVIFENKLYLTNFYKILSINKFTGEKQPTLRHDRFGRRLQKGLFVYHPLLHQTSVKNPCENSTCSDICLLAPSTEGLNYSCTCPLGKTLVGNGNECQTINLIAVSKNRLYSIKQESLGRLNIEEKSYFGVGYDINAHFVYTTVQDTALIYSFNVKSEGYFALYSLPKQKFILGWEQNLGRLSCMHYDEFGNNLYWCHELLSRIEVLSLNTFKKTSIINGTSKNKPIDIALVPSQGFMFVLFTNKFSRVYLKRLSMDGTHLPGNQTQFINLDSVTKKVKLHFDKKTQRLFWANFDNYKISSVNIHGLDKRIHQRNKFIVSFASVPGTLLWTTKESSLLYWLSVEKNYYPTISKLIIDNLNDDQIQLMAFTKSENIESPCLINNGGCSHLCLASNNSAKKMVCSWGTQNVFDISITSGIAKYIIEPHIFTTIAPNSLLSTPLTIEETTTEEQYFENKSNFFENYENKF